MLNDRIDVPVPTGASTGRYASLKAMLYHITGDDSQREEAYRSFNWATYLMKDEKGVVVPFPDAGYASFSGGYADYLRHFLRGRAAVPEWAPQNENHVLASTSVIQGITYKQTGIVYRTYEAQSTERFRLTARPAVVMADGLMLRERKNLEIPRWTWTPLKKAGLLCVRKDSGRKVEIAFREP